MMFEWIDPFAVRMEIPEALRKRADWLRHDSQDRPAFEMIRAIEAMLAAWDNPLSAEKSYGELAREIAALFDSNGSITSHLSARETECRHLADKLEKGQLP